MDDVMVELEATGVLPPIGAQTAPAEHAAEVAPVPAFWKRNEFVAPRAEISPVAARVESPEVAASVDRVVRSTPVEAASVRQPVKEPTYAKADVEITAPRRETATAVTPAHPVAPAHPLAPVAALAKAEASAPATHVPETFSAVPVARGAAALDSRAKALEERERMIEQRERELADQRRVLAEEYRLLRAQHSAASTAAPLAAKETVRVSVPHPATSVRFESMQQETPWTRFKRVVLGRAPAIEEN
jgi:hypothetical protein